MTQLKTALLVMIFATLLLTGCGTRTVLVPPGEPVRLRQPVKAKIWAADKDGKEVPGTVILPEGWYALPPPTKAEDKGRTVPKTVSSAGNEFVLVREGRGDGAGTRKIYTRSE